jgi:hypothetical protein
MFSFLAAGGKLFALAPSVNAFPKMPSAPWRTNRASWHGQMYRLECDDALLNESIVVLKANQEGVRSPIAAGMFGFR